METEQAFKHWNYCIRLARFMLDEALLDKGEFLDRFLLEKLESLRVSDDGLLRFFIPLVGVLTLFLCLKKSNYLCCDCIQCGQCIHGIKEPLLYRISNVILSSSSLRSFSSMSTITWNRNCSLDAWPISAPKDFPCFAIKCAHRLASNRRCCHREPAPPRRDQRRPCSTPSPPFSQSTASALYIGPSCLD